MALTKVPAELSSTPGIVDNSNDTAITIDSSENVLVGKTANDNTTAGHRFTASGFTSHVIANDYPLLLNRLSSDGALLTFRKDSTTVGSIQSRSGVVSTIILDPRTNGAGLTGSTNGLVPVDQTGSGTNNVELGSSGSRFNTLYLGNDIAHLDTAGNARLLYDRSSNLLGNAGTNLYGAGIYLGGTAAANLLDGYEEGTWTPTLNSGSFSSVTATYTKVGSLVQLTLDAIVGTGGGSNVAIPFTCANTTGMAVYTSNQDFAAGRTQFNGVIASSLLFFRVTGDNIVYAAQTLTAGASIHASFTYRTNA